MSGILYPNVPAYPGVPALARLAGANLPLPVLEVADSLGINVITPAWGIFDQSNNLVINATSFVKMELGADSDVPTYPMEEGAFQNYNKVNLPYTLKVTVALSGALTIANAASAITSGSITGAISGITGSTARTKFINAAAKAQSSTDLLNVVTPEITYTDMTITHQEFIRTARKGATLIMLDLWLSHINLSATSSTSNTASINGASSQNAGTNQTQSLTAQISSAVSAVKSKISSALGSISNAL